MRKDKLNISDEQSNQQHLSSTSQSKAGERNLKAAALISAEALRASPEIKDEYLGSKEDEAALKNFAKKNSIWFAEFGNQDRFQKIGEGVEANVYAKEDDDYVYKVNTGIHHGTWLDFFNRLEAHNKYFPNEKYDLIGFTEKNNKLAAIVKQKILDIAGSATPEEIKIDLESRGFKFSNINNVTDEEEGVILRDLHRENAVMTKEGNIAYIDPLIQFEKESKFIKDLNEQRKR